MDDERGRREACRPFPRLSEEEIKSMAHQVAEMQKAGLLTPVDYYARPRYVDSASDTDSLSDEPDYAEDCAEGQSAAGDGPSRRETVEKADKNAMNQQVFSMRDYTGSDSARNHSSGWEVVKFLLMWTGVIAIIVVALILASPGAKRSRFKPFKSGSPYMYDQRTGVICDALPKGNETHPADMPYCSDLN